MPAAVRRLLTGLVLAAVALAATAAAAQTAPAPAPTPDPAITFTGRIGAAGSEPRARLALSDLEKLPQRTFTTHTPWAPVPQTFSGPLLRDVLALARAQGTRIRATALNEYQIEIPVEDARRFDVIVATRIDGKLIPVRERGPFFVIYPFDQSAELRTSSYYTRSIWQLKSMDID